MYNFELTREFAKNLDQEDKLAKYKERFYINEDEIYMDGNSCGLCSRDAEETLFKALKAWKRKSLNITAYMMYLIDEKLTKYGFGVGNPREDAVRGGHVALTHDDALRINEAFKANKIIPDFRYPNVIRLAPTPLYNSYEDVYEMVERIIKIMNNKEYENYENQNREGLNNSI